MGSSWRVACPCLRVACHLPCGPSSTEHTVFPSSVCVQALSTASDPVPSGGSCLPPSPQILSPPCTRGLPQMQTCGFMGSPLSGIILSLDGALKASGQGAYPFLPPPRPLRLSVWVLCPPRPGLLLVLSSQVPSGPPCFPHQVSPLTPDLILVPPLCRPLWPQHPQESPCSVIAPPPALPGLASTFCPPSRTPGPSQGLMCRRLQ